MAVVPFRRFLRSDPPKPKPGLSGAPAIFRFWWKPTSRKSRDPSTAISPHNENRVVWGTQSFCRAQNAPCVIKKVRSLYLPETALLQLASSQATSY